MTSRFTLLLCLLSAAPAFADDTLTGEAMMRDAVTIAISGARIRLEAIIPPEESRMCGNASCVEAAKSELASLIKGHTVTCKKSRRLGHGYFLGPCTADGADLALYLLSQGLALPDADASDAYRAAAEQAEAGKKGVWQSGA
jgi:endonuclease YncB( thermonuclease family)